MSALPALEEPGWYEDDAPGLSVPAQEAPGSGDPVWEAPDSADPAWVAPALGDLAWEAPDLGVPGWEAPDLHDPSDDPPAGAAFADGGWADGLGPDPVLATVVDLVQRAGLGTLDDDQLTGVLQAAGRLAAWSAAAKLAAISALAGRREAAGRDGDWRPDLRMQPSPRQQVITTHLGLGLPLALTPLLSLARTAVAADDRVIPGRR
jgi:hypothetical protein